MAKKRNMDPADQALAEEFGNYISEVASKIIEPISKHIEQFREESNELTSTLNGLKEEMKEVVSSIADGHERTRAVLLAYAKKHSRDARDEMKTQTEQLERSFLEAVEPRLEKLNNEVLTLFEKSVLEHQQAVAKSIARLKIGLGLLALQITAVGVIAYLLAR